MADVGRPSKFTKERTDAILKSISNRIPYELAAEANGICEDTLYEWIKLGRRASRAGIDNEYSKFSESLKKIEQEKIQQHLEMINNMPERWQAQAWILERRWWKYFSPNAAVVEFNKKLQAMEDNDNKEKVDVEALKREAKEITQK